MAKITASVYTSHVPAIGAAIDLGKTTEPYWQPLFKGYEFSKQWMKDNKPDVIILVFNVTWAAPWGLAAIRAPTASEARPVFQNAGATQ